MKKALILLGFLSALAATVISVTHLHHLAIAPLIVAFLSGLIVLFISKKQSPKPKTIQYIFLLVIISLSLTIYKSVFSTSELDNIEQLEQSDKVNSEDSKKILNNTDKDKEI